MISHDRSSTPIVKPGQRLTQLVGKYEVIPSLPISRRSHRQPFFQLTWALWFRPHRQAGVRVGVGRGHGRDRSRMPPLSHGGPPAGGRTGAPDGGPVALTRFHDDAYRRAKRVRCGNMARPSGLTIALNRGERLATTGVS